MSVEVGIKWSGKEFVISLEPTDTVATLKHRLEGETNVLAKRQKILGLKTKDGKAAGDEAPVGELAIKPNVKLMMMGWTFSSGSGTQLPNPAQAHYATLFMFEEAAPEVQVRDGGKAGDNRSWRTEGFNRAGSSVTCLGCLVIDYTIFDLGSTAERPEELARPYLHEFLTSAYLDYDIIIWSATSKKWVEVKMKVRGVLSKAKGRVPPLSPSLHFSVQTFATPARAPPQFVWEKFPGQYTPDNTIMLDDLKRNYIMNPQQGLVIRPFRKAHLTRGSDRELVGLTHYLAAIAHLDSLAALDHNRWERYLEKQARRGGAGGAAGGQ
eukprot:XP_001692348.1 predicted protein [Chlamydomonas reinhardtii]